MAKRSLIYSNVFFYRLVMNCLYAGKYRSRFNEVAGLIGPDIRSVLELCFGDIFIAQACRKRGVQWTGIDGNPAFVQHATQHGYAALRENILDIKTLPAADLCVMMGSLYHFHANIQAILGKMLAAAPRIIISEPVRNLSSLKGPLGFAARRLANAGAGREEFRFTAASLVSLLDQCSQTMGFTYAVISAKRDMIVRVSHD